MSSLSRRSQSLLRQMPFDALLVFGQLTSVAMAVTWLLLDPLAEQLLELVRHDMFRAKPQQLFQQAVTIAGLRRTIAFTAILTCVLLGLAFEFSKLFSRNAARPTLRRLMYVTLIVGLWCGITVGYGQIAWQGKRLRSLGRLHALDQLAVALHDDWPSEDGEIDGLGPFTAYPFGRPRVLLLLTPYPLDGTNTVIAAVERSPQGVLRFQLGGPDGDDWMEWHMPGNIPKDFTGGLADEHGLERYVRLRGNWYLVRYDA